MVSIVFRTKQFYIIIISILLCHNLVSVLSQVISLFIIIVLSCPLIVLPRIYKIPVPANILSCTDNYKYSTDVCLQFLAQCTEDGPSHVRVIDLYRVFKVWFTDNYLGKLIPSPDDFSRAIKRYQNTNTIDMGGRKHSVVQEIALI